MGDDPFRGAIRRTRDSLRVLADVGGSIRAPWGGLPADRSQGMIEVEHERQYAGIWGEQPITTAHTTPGLLFFVAEEGLKTLAAQFDDAAPVPVFLHMPVARTVLEACARAYWLVERSAGVRGRVARLLANRVEDLGYRLDIEDLIDPVVAVATRAERDEILDRAFDRGFARRTRRGEAMLLDEAPGYARMVERLFSGTEIASDDVPAVAYSLYSGVLHARPWALVQSIERGAAPDPLRANLVTAPLQTTVQGAVGVMAIAATGYMIAINEHRELMGWAAPDGWAETCHEPLAAVVERIGGEAGNMI